MAITPESLDLIKRFEGLRLTAYHDVAGVITIGYGHTAAAGEPIPAPGMTVSEREAEAILIRDLARYEAVVDAAVKAPLTPGRRGALVSLCFNIGPGAFRRSTCLARLNAGDIEGCAEAMTWWNRVGRRRVRGLVRRREAERALFLSEPQPADIDEAPQGDVDGGAPKPLTHSKTAWLGGVTFAGALASLRDMRQAVPEVAQYLPWLLAAVGLLIVVNRWREARQGRR